MKQRSIAFLALLWRFIVWTFSILVVGTFVGVVGSIVYTYITTGSITFANPGTLSFTQFLRSHPYHFALISIVILLLTICSYLASRSQKKRLQRDIIPSAEPLSRRQERQNRQRMLAKMRAFWISGYLEQSLQSGVLITPGLQERPDMLANPWQDIFAQPDQFTHQLPSKTTIIKVYDDAVGELLILGEPGAGKTILLVELARDLLDRAEKDENHPIPIVFNLSSWSNKRQALTDWLIEELELKYQVPKNLGQKWVKNDWFVPLLDGLDEVVSEYCSACIDAVNAFRKEHGLLPTVICSRTEGYLAQPERLVLQKAVVVQQLTAQQIEEYLSSAGDQMETLRAALHQNPELLELAATPLMLSILALCYQEMTIEDLSITDPPAVLQQKVFERYVHTMLQRRGSKTRYTSDKMIHYLAWLARQMVQHNQTEFYIELMQPDWLPTGWPRQFYSISVWLLNAPIVGLSPGLKVKLSRRISLTLSFGMFTGLGSLIGLTKKVDSEIKFAEVISWSWTEMWRSLAKSLRNQIIRVLGTGLGIGLIIGSTNGSLTGLVSGLLALLAAGIFFGLPTGLIGGLSYEMLDKHRRVTPYQGIYRSIRNSLLFAFCSGSVVGISFGILTGLIGTLLAGLSKGLLVGLVGGLTIGLVCGVPIGLLTGAGAIVEYNNLQLLLWLSGCIPPEFIPFLNYASECILLRKVGASYIFIHRLLLEYFASLDQPHSEVSIE